jgi:hypothetical protein
VFPPGSWLIFLVHCSLLCLLVVAALCGLERGRLPARLTGLAVPAGLAAATLFPWPWPAQPATAITPLAAPLRSINNRPHAPAAMSLDKSWAESEWRPFSGLAPWPVWGPSPGWMPAGGWLLGLATALVGAGAGLLLARGLFLLFETRTRQPLGTAEADLLIGAGASLGWQVVAVTAVAALPFMLVTALVLRLCRHAGPHVLAPTLSSLLFVTWMGWTWIGWSLQRWLFDGSVVLAGLMGCLSLFLLNVFRSEQGFDRNAA